MVVKVTSNTEKKFKAVVTVPALGIRSQPMIFRGKSTKKIKVDGEDCGAKPWIIRTYQWKDGHWKAARNMTAKLAGDGFIRFKVGDDLMPHAGDRLGIMCSEGSLIELSTNVPESVQVLSDMGKVGSWRSSAGRDNVSSLEDSDEDDDDDIAAAFQDRKSRPHSTRQCASGRDRAGTDRHMNGGSCTITGCGSGCGMGLYNVQRCGLKQTNSCFSCPPKLFFPITPQARYVGERVIEVFTANATGRVELHHIMHPSMPCHSSYEVECIDLTDGYSKHRLTARDVVERTPFSVYGTFDGRVSIVKSSCTAVSGRYELSVQEVWRASDPVLTVKSNQLDNGLLAVTSFQSVPATSSAFVLDLVSQNGISQHPRTVFNAVGGTNILDVCWLWDHPARLLLSTADSIRLFDIRCPSRSDQALFLDHGITHMASNKYRTHVFAGFNGDEVQIYDSRRLFGPIQRIQISLDVENSLSSMKWNPYVPNELLLHIHASDKILRCNIDELFSDPFRRIACTSFSSEEIFSIEELWEKPISSELMKARMNMYKNVRSAYSILSYGKLYDKCMENAGTTMPLCWCTPLPEGAKLTENNKMDGVVPRRRHRSERHSGDGQDFLLCRSHSETCLESRVQTPNPVLAKHRRRKRHLKDISIQSMEGVRAESTCGWSISSSALVEPAQSCNADNEHILELEERLGSSALRDAYEDHTPTVANCDGHRQTSQITTYISNNSEDGHGTQSMKLNFLLSRLDLNGRQGGDLLEVQKIADVALKDEVSGESKAEFPASNLNIRKKLMTNNKADSGHEIKLHYRIYSFDFAPVGYSGLLCLIAQQNRARFEFVPFKAPDEAFAVRPEFSDVLKETRVWESFDSVPYHLYKIMNLRLCNGMDKIDIERPLISILQGLAEQIPCRWMQWLLSAARKQQSYIENRDGGEASSVSSDADDLSDNDRNSGIEFEQICSTSLDVKGLPGLLQLSTLETESDLSWHDCDSTHFTFVKIARSRVRRMLLDSLCLPVSEDRIVSDDKFAASTDILQQLPVLFLCLINGDTIRFIEYTLYLRRKLGKPVADDCSFLSSFHFFTTVVSRYVKQFSVAEIKTSPKYVARRLRLVDKIHAFVKKHSGSSSINPYIIPMLLIILGELTSTHPEEFTKIVLEDEKLPLALRLTWCVNLLPTLKMKDALYRLFQQSRGMERLQFVGLGRHPDSLQVLLEYLYVTKDCQVFSHLLVAGQCLEEDEPAPEKSMTLSVRDGVTKEMDPEMVPSLYTMFPITYIGAADHMPKLLHLARAELCRYSYILQRMEKYCFRRALLNLVPHMYWPNFETSVDISCTFCGTSNETAVCNAESAEQVSQSVELRSTPQSLYLQHLLTRTQARVHSPSHHYLTITTVLMEELKPRSRDHQTAPVRSVENHILVARFVAYRTGRQ
ncbi:unnamed protein product [Cylicocyclus nassatus]|uniref:Uncharacterized protein n=1 Tax=Cylicocyclus nassatus TaxID=53992 RepID=A0AA36MGR4_CYLNA|nr:unnamed protein product [Cylicocyclus nassatus]